MTNEKIIQILYTYSAGEFIPKNPFPSCICDIYLDKNNRVWIVDVESLHLKVDFLLFDKDELNADSNSVDSFVPSLKICERSADIRSKHDTSCRGPIDAIDLISMDMKMLSSLGENI